MSFVLLQEKCLKMGLERGLENLENMMIMIFVIMFLCWFLVFQYSVIFVLCDADVFASDLVECIT
jgi:hypothetical protein